jgi:hypothetical protein
MPTKSKRAAPAARSSVPVARLILAWALLILPAALLCYGFWSQRLLTQAVWNADGFRRLTLACAAYPLFAAGVFLWRPAAFGALLVGGALVWAVSVVGFGPVAAVLFLAISAAALGNGALRWAGGLAGRGEFLLALATGAGLISAGVAIAAHFPVNYRLVYVGALSLPLALAGGSLRPSLERGWRALRTPALRSFPVFGGYALLAFVLLVHLACALKPEVGYDALAVHLMAPAYVESHARWLFDPLQYAWSVMPLGGDWLYTAAYLLGGEFAARLTNLGALLVTVALLHSLARRALPRPAAAVVAALFASTPLAGLVTGSLFIENVLAAMLLAAVFAIDRLRRRGDGASLIAAGILLGVSLSIKLGAVSCAIPLAVFAVVAAVRRAKFQTRHAVVAAAAFLAMGGLPYLYTWMRTGSALYPFVPSIFQSPFPGKFPPAWDSLFRMTFRSHEYLEGQDGSFGFQHLLFAPAALLLAFVRRVPFAARVAGVTALVSAIAIVSAQPYLRYFYPAMALFAVLLISVLGAALRLDRHLFGAVCGAAAVCVLLNLYFLPASGWYQKDFFLPPPVGISAASARSYVMTMAPARGVIDYLNLRRPGEAAWFIGTNNIAGLRGRAYAAVWHQWPFAKEAQAAATAEGIAAVARAHDLKNFVAPTDTPSVTPPAARDFLERNTTREYVYGSMALYRLRRPGAFTEELLPGAEAAERWSGWQRRGSVVIDAAGAARVTLEDTLRKSVPAEPSTTYRYSLEAYCEQPGTVLRLQIDWQDVDGRLLSAASDPHPCSPQWATYTDDFTAPEEAARAVVTVASHTASAVLVRSASLRD